MFEFKVRPECKKTSTGKILFHCSVCSSSYKHEYSLKRHFLRTHVNRAYITASDLTVFQMKLDPHHVKSGENPQYYSCNLCVKLYDTESEVKEHVSAHHQNYESHEEHTDFTLLHCSECEAKFCDRRALNCHLRFHKQDHMRTVQLSSEEPIKPEPPDNPEEPADKQEVTFSKEEGVFTGEVDDVQRGGHQLRERSLQQQGTLFTCTICKKVFQNYGNLLRHRKLSHEAVIKRKPGDKILPVHRKRKNKRRKNPFLKPKIYHHFLSKVSSMVLYNSRNCLHGNVEHVKNSSLLIEDYDNLTCDKTTAEPLKQQVINNCNIRLIPAAQIERNKQEDKSNQKSSKRPLRSTSSIQLNGATSITSKLERSPIAYDRPGYWRFLCLVCYQDFPNTLELFTHQDTLHKGVKTTYLEVAKDTVLPIRHNHEPLGEISGATKHVIGQPNRFKCTKCQNNYNDSNQLHSHILKCGAEHLLKPISIDIPKLQPDAVYGKIKSKKKTKWSREDPAKNNLLITSMPGYQITKKCRKSRLELELEEQQEIEKKIKLAEQMSPPASLLSPSGTSIGKQSEYDWNEEGEDDRSTICSLSPQKLSSGTTQCPYCHVPFSTNKVVMRHMKTSCEMRRLVENSPQRLRLLSPDDKLNVTPINQTSITAQKPSIPHLADILADSDQETQGTQDSQFDSPSPRTSKAQARVLSKFIHPARQCGPCYLCKRPNMARRYTHLQQRSESYVSFVLSKHKFMSEQACICKDCDTKYRKDYQKMRIKEKPQNQSTSITRSDQPLKSAQIVTTTNKKRGRPPKTSNSQSELQVLPIKARKSVSDSIVAKYRSQRQPITPVRRSTRKTKQTGVTSDKKIEPADLKSTTTQPADLTSSSNQSSESETHNSKPSSIRDVSINQSKTNQNDTIQNETIVINTVEKMSGSKSIDLDELPVSADITLNEEQDEDGLIAGKDYLVDNKCDESKYKVIMDFINSSPARVKTTPLNRIDRTTSNITNLIDAVTARVKDQPDLAERLIKAINEAAAANKSPSKRTLTSARGSKSLPNISAYRKQKPVVQPAVRNSTQPQQELPLMRNRKRKQATMTEQAYKNMVEIIDLVACGQQGSLSDLAEISYIEKYSPDLPGDSEQYWDQPDSPASNHGNRLMIADGFQPTNSKNARLANIIDRLSHHSSEAGSSVDSGIDGSFP